jgi:hypothetical protein
MKFKVVSLAKQRVAWWQIRKSLGLRTIRKKSFARRTIKPKSEFQILGRIKNMRARRVGGSGGLARAARADLARARLDSTRLGRFARWSASSSG